MPALYNDDPPGYPYSTKTRADQFKEDLEAAELRNRKLEQRRIYDAVVVAVAGFLFGLAACFLWG